MHDDPSLHAGARPQIDKPDLVAGLVVVAISVVFGWLALGYGVGSPRNMGAGFFPLLLCAVSALLGSALVAKAILRPEPEFERPDLRRFLLVSAAFLFFALGIEPVGLFVTIIATTLIASLAHRDARILNSLLLGIVLAAAIWLIFVRLLGLAIPLWPVLP